MKKYLLIACQIKLKKANLNSKNLNLDQPSGDIRLLNALIKALRRIINSLTILNAKPIQNNN